MGLLAMLAGVAIATTPRQADDWLIHPGMFETSITQHDDTIELNNGLVRRTWITAPTGACVALDNLMTGESVLRAVKPEAQVTIDGQFLNVGGLVGQPNHAFLEPEWLKSMTPDPAAMILTDVVFGEIEPRMEWARVRHAASDAVWPPKGKAIHFTYELPPPDVRSGLDSAFGRTLLFDDSFQTLDREWAISASRAHERTSFENEGKPGEIYALANAHCFAERKAPGGTALVEAEIDCGTDRSTSWGPGLALIFDGRAIELNLRPGDRGEHGHFELRDNGSERLASLEAFRADDGGLETGTAYVLRAHMEGAELIWDVRPTGANPSEFTELFRVQAGKSPIRAIRVGKTDRNAGASDEQSNLGEPGRCRVNRVRIFGQLDPAAIEVRRRELMEARGKSPLRIGLHYEMYDGLPLMSKWITVENAGQSPVRLDSFRSELLAVVEGESGVGGSGNTLTLPNMHVETDYAFGGGMASGQAVRHCVRWSADPEYLTQVNYERKTPCLLEVGPEIGPGQVIRPGDRLTSFRTWELVHDSTDRERKGLALRRMYRIIAPWVTENPLMMHVRWSDWDTVKNAVDQCAEVGFEMVILTFGSGFNIEDDSPGYLAQMKRLADYAHSKGIEIGGYSLLASRRIDDANDVVSPEGKRPTFGNSPCLGSVWGQAYFAKLSAFYEQTGFTLLEHDGSYPGDPCLSQSHPGHSGWDDSRWNQWQAIADFYASCRANGVYLNVPDWYYLAGSNKCGMGYRETNWSLPREQQVVHTRQNIFDGTWDKTPSMGWMFVPLTQYHGGGAAATIEPLAEHLDHYERMLMSNLALGVQACYRGPRLYDTDNTRQLVQRCVSWFKRYREILESDVVHGRRADGRDIDWMLHVNPDLDLRGMLVVFNPLAEPVEREIELDLYYTGISRRAEVAEQDGLPVPVDLDRRWRATVRVRVPAGGMNWYTIRGLDSE